MKEDYISPTEMAKKLGISRQAVIDKIHKGTIKAIKAGQQYIIDNKEVARAAKTSHVTEGDAKKMPKTNRPNKEKILKIVKEKGINTIQLWFVDILGILKCVSITRRDLEEALYHGKGFDGSSVTGFAEAQESDIIAMPDPATFQILPWEGTAAPVARLFCDILNPDRTPYAGDSRYALKRALERAKKLGFIFYIGPELEYFYFKSDRSTDILDEGTYFELIPSDIADVLRNKTVNTLENMGIPMEASHHEVAPSQHEIDLKYNEALMMADNIITARYCIKEVARSSNVYATFMPKPMFGVNGSGMHVHQSLFRGNTNAFYDKDDKHHLSAIAKQFIAGQLKHSREICALTAQWVNSYKRLVAGYEAPVYASWAQRNRTALIRVPLYRPGNEKATRAELRCPDPSCNPYLAFAVMLAAGLEGIEKKYKAPDPVEPNIYKMEMSEREHRGLVALPGNLYQAIAETEKSALAKVALGEHIFTRFLINKKKEWEDYRIQITGYEIKKYLPIL
ncbi:MAG: glutamine synthetase beta-grasp domain-containing protein [Candidatus Omnitrophota bacterium]